MQVKTALYLRGGAGGLAARLQYHDNLESGHEQRLGRQVPERAGVVDVVHDLDGPGEEEEVVVGLGGDAQVVLTQAHVCTSAARAAARRRTLPARLLLRQRPHLHLAPLEGGCQTRTCYLLFVYVT